MLKRGKLYAVVCTVIEGYKETLSNDEDFAKAVKKRHLTVINSIFKKFNGQIFEMEDDRCICIFKDPKEAVDFSIEAQTNFLNWPKLPIKIGIDYGRVGQFKDTIIGKVLDITEGVAKSAKSGSVIITSRVHSRIAGDETLETEFLDIYEIGKIAKDVQLYTIANKDLVIPEPEEIDAIVKELPPSPKHRKSSISHILISIGTLIAASALFAYLNVLSADKVIDDYSIAILPFESINNNKESDLVSEALTKDILFNLSLVEDLSVISSYTTMNIMTEGRSANKIANQLGVAYILKGSSHKFGDNLRVSVELLNIDAKKVIWQETYNRKYSEIMAIQAEISKEIVDALRLRLSFDEMQYLVGTPTGNIDAYIYFVQGRHAADLRTAAGNKRSIELYSRAIRIDTTFAEAYVELANSNLDRVKYKEINASNVSNLVELYITRAKSLNENLSRIHTVEGKLYNFLGEYEKAEPTLMTAVEVSPNSVEARLELANLYHKTKQIDRQIEQTRVAYKLDPLNPNTGTAYAIALISKKEFNQAETLLNRISSGKSPRKLEDINKLKVALYFKSNNYKKAFIPLLSLAGRDSSFLGTLGYAYAKSGDSVRAQQIVDSLREFPSSSFKKYNLAKVFAGFKRRDSVIKYLDDIDIEPFMETDSIYNFFDSK